MRRRTIRRALAAAGATAVVGATLLTAAPTQAADTCTTWQDREFSTPGYNTDVEVMLCVFKGGSSHNAYGRIRWEDGGGAKKFDNFDLHVRLERYDADKDAVSCDYTSEINASSSGVGYCPGATSMSSGYGSWSADGYVAFDYDADGQGGDTWSLKGSPLIN
jgi:hypothetical protein